jgi:hypothetical protein
MPLVENSEPKFFNSPACVASFSPATERQLSLRIASSLDQFLCCRQSTPIQLGDELSSGKFEQLE